MVCCEQLKNSVETEKFVYILQLSRATTFCPFTNVAATAKYQLNQLDILYENSSAPLVTSQGSEEAGYYGCSSIPLKH